MAEIRIKKKRPVWPWILLLVIVGALVFLYIYGSTEDEEEIKFERTEEVTFKLPGSQASRNNIIV
ncbi:hypothetical protein [Christiangramia aquimixticola]|uniref:hypothetical protein n=1 Tax=Christiangramia aquimixticola TaxID=1697558 RepID=UPI003AA8E774